MYPWYDGLWLADRARARAILARERPGVLETFDRRLKVFEAPAGRRFCELLFFHFIPAGTRDLVMPSNWARIFGVPQLAGLGRADNDFV